MPTPAFTYKTEYFETVCTVRTIIDENGTSRGDGPRRGVLGFANGPFCTGFCNLGDGTGFCKLSKSVSQPPIPIPVPFLCFPAPPSPDCCCSLTVMMMMMMS